MALVSHGGAVPWEDCTFEGGRTPCREKGLSWWHDSEEVQPSHKPCDSTGRGARERHLHRMTR